MEHFTGDASWAKYCIRESRKQLHRAWARGDVDGMQEALAIMDHFQEALAKEEEGD